MTNVEKVRLFVTHAHNTPFHMDQVIMATGLSETQVKRAMRDINVAGLTKRADGRFQVKGRKVN